MSAHWGWKHFPSVKKLWEKRKKILCNQDFKKIRVLGSGLKSKEFLKIISDSDWIGPQECYKILLSVWQWRKSIYCDISTDVQFKRIFREKKKTKYKNYKIYLNKCVKGTVIFKKEKNIAQRHKIREYHV